MVEDSAGVPHTIATKGADAAEKTLGLIICPSGKMDAQKDEIIDKCNEWIGQFKNGYLPRRSVWTLFWRQLWSSLRWDIGTFQFTQKETEDILGPIYYQLLPYLGVNRNITKEWQTLPLEYLGLGLPKFGLEMTIGKINLLLQNFDEQTPLGMSMQASYEQLELELGVGGCAFQQSFATLGHLATKSWVKYVWEGAELHGAKIEYSQTKKLLLQQVNDE